LSLGREAFGELGAQGVQLLLEETHAGFVAARSLVFGPETEGRGHGADGSQRGDGDKDEQDGIVHSFKLRISACFSFPVLAIYRALFEFAAPQSPINKKA
jgi:hypothetical protein